MPTGFYYSLEFRKTIHLHHVIKNRSPEWIMENTIHDPGISLSYLTNICQQLQDPVWAGNYLLGAKEYNKTGRKRKIQPEECFILKTIK